ncbi:unnamed protein product [Didymodactylos carnosus]|uniref:Carboxylesterase type B domain-containing protein n=1 Tax=Didymodactylos carnosus TaxID=1234261 RepID=A0A816B7J1_9BILA|nr:unnamed protein product [Didymodactylos carnosus]CAF4452633.1 unnamed protein product [Didymodactylos carnosus]CAF4484811.1 unnamed protein product [Didymodactylos carnosus]
MKQLIAFYLLFMLCNGISQRKTEIISTPSGRIDGIYNRYAQLFLGIPYAQPPLNKLRFQLGDWGLFHKVLIQSPTIGVRFRTKDNAQQFNNRFSELLNCRSSSDELQCLQAKTWQEICQAQTTTADLIELNAFSIQKFRPWEPALGLSRFRLIYNSTQIFQEVIH